jgi:hypothetical protein
VDALLWNPQGCIHSFLAYLHATRRCVVRRPIRAPLARAFEVFDIEHCAGRIKGIRKAEVLSKAAAQAAALIRALAHRGAPATSAVYEYDAAGGWFPAHVVLGDGRLVPD